MFILHKEPDELSDNELRTLQTKVLDNLSNVHKSLSAICLNFNDDNCRFCALMNSLFPNKDGSTKIIHNGTAFDSAFRGCEQDNIILHPALGSYDAVFECFSRARQNSMVILNKQDLRGVWALPRTFKELLRHEEICNNETCKEKGWDKLKVIDVEYIGLEGYTAIDDLESFIL